MIRIIERDDLVTHTAQIGARVYEQLEGLQKEPSTKGLLINLRGKGCVDCHVG